MACLTSEELIETIDRLKGSDINGCITGSCMWAYDMEVASWKSVPDIDMFVYSTNEMIAAVRFLEYCMGFEFGSKWDDITSRNQEKMKFKWVREGKKNMKFDRMLQTVKMVNYKGVIVNISCKQGQQSIIEVLGNFDMSIIQRGWDIKNELYVDMRGVLGNKENLKEAHPNVLRKHDSDMYTTAQWLRQWDRVIKYWQRGFDTRPMARWYLHLINDTLDAGMLWTTEKYKESYLAYSGEFVEMRDKISEWLEEVED